MRIIHAQKHLNDIERFYKNIYVKIFMLTFSSHSLLNIFKNRNVNHITVTLITIN